MKPEPPCLDCEERRARCHGRCKRYKAFRKALDEYNALVEEQRDWRVTEYEYNRALKLKK